VAAKKNRALYQFKVTLRGIHPRSGGAFRSGRRDACPAASRVADGHGLEDYHLHEFRIGRKI